MLFEHFPYTNFHDLNLDWIIKKVKQMVSSFSGTTATSTTLPTGSDATVSVTGGSDGAPFVFAFGLPRGVKGDTGATGARGPQGIQGETGATGAAGQDGKSFEITGQVDTVAELPVSPPVGTAYYVGTTVPRYVYGYINYNGTNQWVNQGTLEGPTGPTGPQGPQGIQGVQGIQGESGELAIDEMSMEYSGTVVDYNTTDGITIDATGRLVNDEDVAKTFDSTVKIPMKATNGLTMDADEDNEYIEISVDADDETLKTNASGELEVNAIPVLTEAPTSANTEATKIVYLASEPATKYSGYIYLIAE